MKRRAIIMDRDATVCDGTGAAPDPGSVRLRPGSAEAIRKANESGFQTVLMAPTAAADLLEELHDRVRELLAEEGARLDGIYVRPAGTLERARNEMGIDLASSYMIGGRVDDLEEGARAGTTNVLIGRDGGARLPDRAPRPAHVAPDLDAAVSWILEREEAR